MCALPGGGGLGWAHLEAAQVVGAGPRLVQPRRPPHRGVAGHAAIGIKHEHNLGAGGGIQGRAAGLLWPVPLPGVPPGLVVRLLVLLLRLLLPGEGHNVAGGFTLAANHLARRAGKAATGRLLLLLLLVRG